MDRERLERARQFAAALCHYGEQDEIFLADFWSALEQETDILEEFCQYMDHREFACGVSVQGYTVIDIMIWQIDHFKARMDHRDPGMGGNGDKMLLMAFDTLLKMKKEPERYVRMMQGETGTDYPEKY